MVILGIESTCDETGVGIVENVSKVLSNVVSSSSLLHKKYGGVVPEVAAREQVKLIVPVIGEALLEAKCKLAEVDAIAVAYGPGLIGSLLIGVEAAKTLSLTLGKPLYCVNHLAGHVYANWLNEKPRFPLVALIVSGGHTDLILMSGHGKYRWLGGTRDDAAGEVFDKVARVLDLGYPGGPEIERCAQQLTIDRRRLTLKFPRPLISDVTFDFSFAGLKTAVVNHVGQLSNVRGQLSAIAFEFQSAIVEVLVKKTVRAAKKYSVRSIVVGGGVAANQFLRSEFAVYCSQLKIPVFFPSKDLSVDNGAMIATAAFFGKKSVDPLQLQADPALHF